MVWAHEAEGAEGQAARQAQEAERFDVGRVNSKGLYNLLWYSTHITVCRRGVYFRNVYHLANGLEPWRPTVFKFMYNSI